MSSAISPITKLLGSSIRSLEAIVRPCASVQSRSYPPVEPMEGACCGQGCSNCVWVVYAQELIDYYRRDRLEETIREIEMKVPDQNVRAFVLSELRSKWNRS
ncbi:hypothetical protein V3C99_010912 [Haemonchus contortus]|uniref:Oxidoreductase-like domain-containing protein n=1 Tax=Haemonchus contortus TaxID=6289 RepID=A0A7I4Y755_HAECO